MAKKYTKMEWCCIQKKGIKLVTPNEILGRSYLDNAEEDLLGMQSNTFKVQNSSAYNACYNSFYSILQKVGIKCEIHDCTFEFFSLIPDFTKEQINLVSVLKKNNLEIEQCLKKPKPVNPQPVEEFVSKSKQVFESLSPDKIRLIRQEVISAKKHKS